MRKICEQNYLYLRNLFRGAFWAFVCPMRRFKVIWQCLVRRVPRSQHQGNLKQSQDCRMIILFISLASEVKLIPMVIHNA